MTSRAEPAQQTSLCVALAATLQAVGANASPAARTYARRGLLDTIGAALAGVAAPEAQKLTAALRLSGKAEAPVWGTGLSASAGQAALANGTAAHAFEVDDFGGCGHSGAVVVPAVLAAAARYPASGADLVTAIVVGYEAAARLTDAMGGYPAHNAAGWHSTGTCGAFGAAAATATLAGLDAQGLAHALALAGSYVGGTWSFIADGAMNKRLHAGKAAEAGVMAALLAAEGFSGPLHLFEPGWGSFIDLYAGANGCPDALVAHHDEALIFRSGFKLYACCRGCHSTLDVALDLQRRHGFAAGAVERVVVRGTEQHVRQLGKQDVVTALDAQMSLPYSVAVALSFGGGELRYYGAPYLGDPDLGRLARRVSVVADASGPATREPDIEVHLTDGRTLNGRVDIAKGAAANPLSDVELADKFRGLAGMTFSGARTEAILDMVLAIETAPSLQPLLDQLACGRDSTP